jgi:hypothetical protein
MYKINDILLSDYGISPAKANGTNLALSGFLDMPARLGKTFHSWGDEHGIEPYVAASEINLGGRTLTFNGLLKAIDRADAIAKIQVLENAISNFTGLVVFLTPFSRHDVYVKEAIQVAYLGDGWASISLKLQEPFISFGNAILTSDGDTITDSDNNAILFAVAPMSGPEAGIYTIDGLAFGSFGAFLRQSNGLLNSAATKEQEFTSYQTEGYQLTKRQANEIEIDLVFKAESFAGLKSNIADFQNLLTAPGLRFLNVDGYNRSCFVIDGFTVQGIFVLDGISIALLSVSFLMASALEITLKQILTSDGDLILTSDSDALLYN